MSSKEQAIDEIRGEPPLATTPAQRAFLRWQLAQGAYEYARLRRRPEAERLGHEAWQLYSRYRTLRERDHEGS